MNAVVLTAYIPSNSHIVSVHLHQVDFSVCSTNFIQLPSNHYNLNDKLPFRFDIHNMAKVYVHRFGLWMRMWMQINHLCKIWYFAMWFVCIWDKDAIAKAEWFCIVLPSIDWQINCHKCIHCDERNQIGTFRVIVPK